MSGYIGTQPVPQATQTRDSFTATSGQTSFATGGYTPNFLDVYLNGVKLAAADYTASNGSDVVLSSGAATGDILEVVAYTTFTPADIPDGTPSIDDNGNATALTIDSSENILAGKTSADFGATAGLEFRGGATDTLFLASDGNKSLALNRNTSDGEIIRLSKSDSTVGSIGTIGSDIVIGSGNTGLRFYEADNSILPSSAAGQASNGTLDIGDGSFRWKDLYLSGGVYLGGTGSANKLEDYEEGTWTPTNAGDPTGTISANGKYVKIGRQVTCHATMSITATFTNATLGGLPFNPHHEATLSSIHGAAIAIGSNIKMVSVNNGSANLTTRDLNDSGDNPNSPQLIRFSITYQTNG